MTRSERKDFLLAHLDRLVCGRDILPLENDTLPNPPWEDATCRILISRLSPSKDVEESVSHLVLFSVLRRLLPGAYLDFSFFPKGRDRKVLESGGCGSWYGIQSFESAAGFDLILVSVSYVLEILNLPVLLASAGLKPQRDGTGPVILAGGSAALMAQGLTHLVDALYTDTFESLAGDLVELLAAGKAAGASPAGLQAGEAKASPVPGGSPGVARPRVEPQALRAGLRVIPGMVWNTGGVLNPGQPARDSGGMPGGSDRFPVLGNTHAGTVRLMISSGCPFRCSFCFEGAVRKPYAEAPSADLVESARRLRASSGAESVDLLSFNFNTHRDIMGLITDLYGIFPFVHLMSQRLDILYRRPELLSAQIVAGKRSYTLGIEGISGRMRSFFRKDLQDEAVTGIITRLLQAGAREIKCFYILSGYENEEDLREFAAFLKHCMDSRRALGSGATLLFSFGYLSVMPHTP